MPCRMSGDRRVDERIVVSAASGHVVAIALPYRPLIDALPYFADRYAGDIAYLHSVGPAITPAFGDRPSARARYSLIGVRAYRISADCECSENCAVLAGATPAGAIGYHGYDDGISRWAWFDMWLVEDHRDLTMHAVAMGRLADADTQIEELKAAWALSSSVIDCGTIDDGTIGGGTIDCGTMLHDAERDMARDAVHDAEFHADQSRDSYVEAVRRMQRHMRDGDIYVANMSMRFTVHSDITPINVFRRLYADNPSPYAAYLDFGDRVIVSSSPERFFSIWDGRVVTEPIKGTRPRGATAAEDAELRADLRGSNKERSELLMVTDLERNDMNRICVPGSVCVPEFEVIRAFPHVFHTVSVVEGRLRAGMTVSEALRMMSPGGSITGTPKRRAMEIIAECERSPRDAYTGGLGYVGADPGVWLRMGGLPSGRLDHGSQPVCGLRPVCDLSIIIRAAICQMGRPVGTGRFDYLVGAGGGVTLDSDPEAEYDEAVHKARAVLEALGVRGGER